MIFCQRGWGRMNPRIPTESCNSSRVQYYRLELVNNLCVHLAVFAFFCRNKENVAETMLFAAVSPDGLSPLLGSTGGLRPSVQCWNLNNWFA